MKSLTAAKKFKNKGIVTEVLFLNIKVHIIYYKAEYYGRSNGRNK